MSQIPSNFRGLTDVASLSPRAKKSVAVGRIVGLAENGHPLVDYVENEVGPIPARYVVAMQPEVLVAFAERGQEVLLTFDGDDARHPIITGILQDVTPTTRGGEGPSDPLPEMLVVNGQRLRFEGKDEIVLACGQASITLRRNGKVIIRGTHVESDSLGANWIRGADIQIG